MLITNCIHMLIYTSQCVCSAGYMDILHVSHIIADDKPCQFTVTLCPIQLSRLAIVWRCNRSVL